MAVAVFALWVASLQLCAGSIPIDLTNTPEMDSLGSALQAQFEQETRHSNLAGEFTSASETVSLDSALEAQFDAHRFELSLEIQKQADQADTQDDEQIENSETCKPTVLHASKDSDNGRVNPQLGFGVALELLSCVFSNMGLLMEKRALLAEEKRLGNVANVKSYQLPLWWTGFLVFVVAQVISGFALAFVTVVVVAPLGSFSLVVNLFTSYFYAKEPTNVLQIFSSLTIVAGCVLTTAFAPWRKANSSMNCFRYYVGQGDFHLVSGFIVSILILVLCISRSLVLPAQKQTSDQTQWHPSAKFGRWLYPVASGLTAVWTINVGAIVMRFLSEQFSGEHILDTWEFWVVLAIYLCLIIGWQNQMNACMIVLNAAYVIPINFAFLTMLTLPFSGSLHGTLFDWHPDALALVMYLAGLSMSILGMAGLLASSKGDSPAKRYNHDSDTAAAPSQKSN